MQVEIFVEMFEMEIVQQMGMSGTRLNETDNYSHLMHGNSQSIAIVIIDGSYLCF